jgi:hypothetical protein
MSATCKRRMATLVSDLAVGKTLNIDLLPAMNRIDRVKLQPIYIKVMKLQPIYIKVMKLQSMYIKML